MVHGSHRKRCVQRRVRFAARGLYNEGRNCTSLHDMGGSPMMYDNRFQRRQMRQMRRMNRRYYRNSMGGLAGGFFFIGLAIAIALSSTIGGNWFLPVFFAGLAFCALIGS